MSKMNSAEILSIYKESIEKMYKKACEGEQPFSEDEVSVAITAYSDILRFYHGSDSSDRKTMYTRIKELMDEHGALESYSDKSIVIYAYDGIQGIINLEENKIKEGNGHS